MDALLKSVCTASFGITHTTCHLQVQFQIHPLLNILTVPDWPKFKFNYFLVGPKVKILNTLTPLASIYVTLFHCCRPCEHFHARLTGSLMCKRD